MPRGHVPQTPRRRPSQERAQHTVEAILDAVLRILKRYGVDSVTTNRIAEVAGVSIGSIYQYFPDKHAIYAALHERHIAEVDRVIGRTLAEHAESDLKTLARALLESIINAHLNDKEGLAFLISEVPHRSQDSPKFAERVSGALRLIVSSRIKTLSATQLTEVVFVLANMFEALSHAAVLWRPATMSLEDAKEQSARAIFAYIDILLA